MLRTLGQILPSTLRGGVARDVRTRVRRAQFVTVKPEKTRVLITVKTYPTLSLKYGETVCTAGVREDGSWVRIYPVPFRRLGEKEQYSKYDWLDCALVRNSSDPRPETFRPHDAADMQPTSHLGTADDWRERRKLLLQTAPVYTRLGELIDGAKANLLSLAVFKPTRVLGFTWEEEEREWDAEKLRQMREQTNQLQIFGEDAWRQTFKVIPKLPYSFSYQFEGRPRPQKRNAGARLGGWRALLELPAKYGRR